MLFPANGARAGDPCAIARILLATEISSEAILLAPNAPTADRVVRELEARLDRVEAYVSWMARLDWANAELAEPMARFVENRRRVVALYRTRGLAAARGRALDAEFVAALEGVREVLRRGAGCVPAGERSAPLEPAADGGPRTMGDAPPRLDPLGLGGRSGPEARERVPPPSGIWFGVAVLVALCLMLIGIIFFDFGERREEPRFACYLPGRLRVRGVDRRVVLVEISRGGAKLKTAERFAVGERGVLVLLGVPAVFKVVWATPSYCGTCFRRKLDVSNEQLARLSAVEPRPDPDAPSLAAK